MNGYPPNWPRCACGKPAMDGHLTCGEVRCDENGAREAKSTKVGRLALRQEGANWNAYYALTDTMEGAIPLGSIALRFVVGHPERHQAFMDLMREAVSDLIEELTGHRPTWPEGVKPAPHHERAGHG